MIKEIATPNLVAEGTRVRGTLLVNEQTQVYGNIEGDLIQSAPALTQVGKVGWVRGSIFSKGPVFIEGRVEGDLVSETRIRLASTARVFGSLTAPVIEIQAGALYEGETRMGTPASTLPALESTPVTKHGTLRKAG